MRKNKRIAAAGILAAVCILSAGCAGKQQTAGTESAPVFAENVSAEPEESEPAGTDHAETAVPGVGNMEPERMETGSGNTGAKIPAPLADGVYSAEFITDSSMFRVNEACDGRGTLTVEDGTMIIHVSLGSKHIVNLYCGLAEDAAKEGAELLSPTVDSITYSDGWTEDVYGFDIPVPALDEEFDLALIGTKEKWYDHKVRVANPQPLETEAAEGEDVAETADSTNGRKVADGSSDRKNAADETSGGKNAVGILAGGVYSVEFTFDGGSGRAALISPAAITVTDGAITAAVQWNSPNYDYMVVDGEKYLPVNTEGDSVFEIPVSAFDEPILVIGDTVAMSKPHEIEYTLTFHWDTIKALE